MFGLGSAQLDLTRIRMNPTMARYNNTPWKYFIVSKDLLKTIHLLLAEV